jgi:hypothetical protein
MSPVPLEGHYGQQVPTDLCPRCHLVWFDDFESVRLSGLGWVGLLRQMQAAAAAFSPSVPDKGLACPRCSSVLKPVHNLTRFGRYATLQCPHRHGHLQTFSLLLAERGLVRPMDRRDLRTLAAEGREPTCLNCGASVAQGGERCSHCDSPLVVIDMPRLMSALLVRHAEPLPAEAAQHVAWPCRGCGAALEPTHTAHCGHCRHVVVVPSFVDLRPLLDKVEPLLRGVRPRAAQPHGARLRALRGDHRATGAYQILRHLFDSQPSTPIGWAALAGLVVLGWFLLR